MVLKLAARFLFLLFLTNIFFGIQVFPQTFPLSFTSIPVADPDLNAPGRGVEQWHDRNDVNVPVEGTNTQRLDVYQRFVWTRIEGPTLGSYTWSFFDGLVNDAITKKQKLSFGIMTLYPGGTVQNGLVSFDGGVASYPLYLHTLMQSETVKDWRTGTIWTPNYNSIHYQNRLLALHQAIDAHIKTTSFNGVPYKNVISCIDIRGYGAWGEWHSGYTPNNVISDYPAGTFPTVATLKKIVDAHTQGFPDFPLVAMIAAFDANWLQNTKNPPEIAHYVLTQRNNWGQIGWRRDQWGATDAYLRDYLENNNRSFGGIVFKDSIMVRWKSAPITGEPPAWSPNAYTDLEAQVRLYHAASFGNGNYGTTLTTQIKGRVRAASKACGYRLILEGGNLTLNGNNLTVALNWKNIGLAPTYENWNVEFELKNSNNQIVWSGQSQFKPKWFLPSGTATIVTDNFTALPVGTFNLNIIIKDANGYRDPFPLAITGRNADGSYPLKQQITIQSPVPPPSVAVTDNCGYSVLTASGYTGTLLWSTGENTPGISVTAPGLYTVTQTVSGMTSAFGSATAAPKAIPSAPGIAVVNNCGNSLLTATGVTGTILWSTNETNGSITVTTAATYTVTQSVNGCASAPGSATVSPPPFVNVPAPVVNVANNCSSSLLTATGAPGATFLWSTGATTEAINVTTNNTYTVRQTVNNCTSPLANATAAPKPIPALTGSLTAAATSSEVFSYTASSTVSGTTITWSRATVPGISNGPNNGTGNISEILVNTTASPVNVTYVYTLTANGCTNTQNLVVTVAVDGSTVAPQVTTQPASQTWCAGEIATFNSGASGGPAPTVQWQESTNGTTWTNIGGATSSTLSFTTAIGDNNKQYRAVWTNIAGVVNSNAATLTVNAIPSAPSVSVTDNCGSSLLTASGAGTTFTWSVGAPANPITVTAAGTYTVTQTLNGCTGPSASATAAPKSVPSAPSVSVIDNCGSSLLTASGAGTTFTWSVGAPANPITVTLAGTYTVTQTLNGCTGPIASATAAPKPVPALSGSLTAAATSSAVFTYAATSGTAGTTFAWSRAAVSGVSNAANSGTGDISEILVNTTASPVNVTYVYTLTANGCTNTQNLVVTVAVDGSTVAPQVTTQPASQTWCAGEIATFNSGASGGPAPTVQWQESTNGTTWTNIGGATSSTLSFTTAIGDNNKQYRAVWTNIAGVVNSNAATLTVNAIPSAPSVSVTDNCGSSLLTASGAGTTFTWSVGAPANPITVTAAGTYTVTQTLNGCTGPSASATAAPKSVPSAPSVSVIDNCGSSLLTASGAGTTFTWSVGAPANPITVTLAGTYTVTQTLNGCTGPIASATAAPKPVPALSGSLTAAATSSAVFTYAATSGTAGTTFAWSRAAVSGVSNAANSGTGDISEILVNTTASPVNVTYVYTLTANGCTNTQNLVVTVAVDGSTVAPQVTTQPASQTWCAGEIATFNSGASGGPAPTVQWQESTNGTNWNNISGATASTLSFTTTTTTADNNKQYRAVWNNIAGTVNSNAAVLTVNPIQSAPSVSVSNDCGTSSLTATGAPGATFLWSTGETTGSITVPGGNYTVTQTLNGCTSSPSASATAAPKSIPATPNISVENNCGSSTLTAAGDPVATFLWSTGATTEAINVTTNNTYTVRQTVNNCTSPLASATSAPKPIPALSGSLTAAATSSAVFTYAATSGTAGTTFAWSRAAVSGVSNAANSGTGDISEILVNTTASPVNVTYVYTLTANGCTNTQNLVVTVAVDGSTVAPQVTTQPASQTWCAGEIATFNSGASGGPAPTVQWQESTNGTNWNNISGATASTLSFATTTADNNKQYRAVWTNIAGVVNSNAATLTVNAIPSAPSVSVTDNCGSSLLTASGAGTTFTWSVGAPANPITVTAAGTYTVTQTLNGCTGPSASATAAPKSVPSAPSVSVIDNCGSSLLTASGAGTTFTWSVGAPANPITVTLAGTYTVTQTLNGCTGPIASATAAPKPIPALTGSLTAAATSSEVFSYTASSTVSGTTFTWSRATVPGVSNGPNNGTGNISEILVNTTASPVNVTYVYTLTANGCTNTQNLVVTVAVDGSTVAPQVTTQPASQTWCAGEIATFNSGASGGPAPTVQWQESTNGTNWNNISGATASTLSFTTTTADNNKQYRAVWTNIAGVVNSNAATLTVNAIPSAPSVSVTDNCGSSLLTASGAGTTFTWSVGAPANPITVTAAGTYTVTQTLNGCTGPSASATAAPKSVPSAPSVSVIDNCGSSLLTASGAGTTFTWSVGAPANPITVTLAGTYTVTQTLNGCTGPIASATAAPKPVPALTGSLTAAATSSEVFSYTASSTVSGTTITWSRAAVSGVSNAANSGTGDISEILVNTTASPVNVTYVYTLTANGCTNTQNLVVTVAVDGSTVAPQVTTQPASQTWCAGEIATFNSGASGGPAPTVQWQESTNGTTWTNIGGATSSTLSFTTAIGDNNKQYRAVWTNIAGVVNSNAATLTVNAIPSAPSVSVTDNCGSSLLTASGAGTTFTWSVGAPANPITVTAAGTYTVTQTLNGCTGPSASATAAPKSVPSAPSVSVIDNCGSSLLTASGAGTTFTWSVGAPANPITVTLAGTYTVTQTLNGCTGPIASATAAPKPIPALSGSLTAAATSSAVFTYAATSSTAGTAFAWSRAAVSGVSNAANSGTGDISEILVNTTASPVNVTYVYTLTANGCTNTQNLVVTVAVDGSTVAPQVTTQPASQTKCAGESVLFNSGASGGPAPTVQWQESTNGTTWTNIGGATSSTLSFTTAIGDNNKQYRAVWTNIAGVVNSNAATLTVNAIPSAPSVSVTDNCGSSLLTASGAGTTFTWSVGAPANPITVTAAGTYTVTQTLNGCTGPSASATAAPKSVPSAPSVSVIDNCGSSLLTASGAGTTFTWSVGAPANPITVTLAGTYTVTQTLNGCTGPIASATAAPKPVPALTGSLTAAATSSEVFSYTASSTVSGTTITWSRAAVSGVSNAANSGTGDISEIFVNTTASPVNVTYVYTLTANGCTNTQNLVVTVAVDGSTVAPQVTTQPASQTKCAGESVLFNSGASGGPAPTVQWQESTNGTNWNNISGATASTLSFTTTTADNNKQYRAVWNNIAGTVNSNAAVLTVNPIQSAPSVSVSNDCGTSSLTATGAPGATFLWSTGETTGSITVPGGNYTVTQTLNGCTSSPSASATAAPKSIPATPNISVENNCGSSTLTAAGDPVATFLWSTGATTEAINVTTNNTYTVRQTVNNCTSPLASATSAPKPIPALTGSLTAAATSSEVFSYTASSTVSGTTITWSRATVPGISNGPNNGTGNISEIFVNTTASPVNVTYVYTLTANGCTNTQNLVVTVAVDGSTVAPQVTTQPASQTWCAGEIATFNSGASGGPAPTVQWQESTNGTNWNNISGATASTLSFTTTTADNNKQYRAVWTNIAGVVNSNAATLTVNAIPSAPSVSVTDNCGSSLLTASGAGTTFTWSVGAPANPITVTAAGTYTVTQTLNGCTGPSASATAAPKSVPSAPSVSVIDNCGSSLLTASGAGTTFTWSVGAPANPITVTLAGTYTVTQTLNGCTGPIASATAAPKPVPALSGSLTAAATSSAVFTYAATSSTAGTAFAWSRAAVSGVSNAANSGTGDISEILVNTTASPVNVTYVYTLTANGCTNTQNLVVTVAVDGSTVAPQVTTQPASQTKCAGESVLFNSGASGGPAPTVQWQESTNGTTWTNIGGATSSTLSFTTAIGDNNKQYRAVWTNIAGVVNSNAATLTVNAIPSAPSVSVTDNCGSSLLTASGAGTTFTWSVGAPANPITVTAAGTYTVTQTLNGCTGPSASATAAPKSVPSAPSVSVIDNCGSSLLTASGAGTTFTWSVGAPANPITVTLAGTYTVTQTLNGCTGPIASATAAPKPVPALTGSLTAAATSSEVFSYTASSTVSGTTFTWSRAAVPGISNAANSGTGDISEIFVNTTASPVNVTYVYTLTANGCTNTQNLVVTVAVDGSTVAPQVTTQPASQTWCAGEIATFNSGASGGPAPTVQWQESTNGTNWNNISGATASTLSFTTTTADNNKQYRAVWTNIAGVVNSNAATLTVNAIPSAPSVSVTDNCGSSLLTASGAGTTFTWSVGAPANPITVTAAGTYTVTQTLNGCTGPSASATAAPKSVPSAPSVSVIDNCGSSLLTASGAGTTFTWSVGAPANPITVTLAGTYTVTQTLNGCTGPIASATAAPKPIPALTGSLTAAATSSAVFTYAATSGTAGTTFAWSRAAVSGVSNGANSGTGDIGEILVNTTASPVNVTYVYTLTANGCTNTQNLVVTVAVDGSILVPLVTTHPSSQAKCAGENVIFNSGASGSPAPAVQWQENTNGTNWTNIGGATSSTLSFTTTTADNNKQYRAVWSNTGGNANSNAATLTVNPIPSAPSISVSNNCGSSVLTATGATGASFSWNTGATNSFITVSAGTFTVTQTVNGCTSPLASVTAAPKPIPALSSSLATTTTSGSAFTYTPTSSTPGTSFTWSRAAVSGVSNAAANGNGIISEALVNTTTSPVNVPYVYTLTANGCTNNQNVVVTVNAIIVAPAVATQPASQSRCAGVSASFSSAASGIPAPTVQWQVSTNGTTWNNITGATTSTLSFATTTTDNNKQYRAVWTNLGGTVNSNAATLTVNAVPVLSSSLTATATSGTAFAYTPASATTGTTFAWSRAVVAGISNATANGNGNVSETLINTTTSPVNVTYVYTLTANGCSNTQNVVVTVNANIIAPAVTTQPASQTRCAGVNASFSSAASGSPAPAVQWQVSTNGTTWTNITGATSSAYSFATTTADNNKQYRAIWTNAGGTANSNSATLTVNPTPVLSSSLSANATSGTAFIYTATSSTPGTTFAWSRAAVTGISNAAGNGTGNINETLLNTTASPVNVTYVYTLIANGCTNNQNVVVTVGTSTAAPVVTTQPASQTRCAGSNASFTSAASGSPAPTVQWQVSTNGFTWSNITGATASTLSFATTTAVNNRRYRARWTNAVGAVNSNAATLTVTSTPSAPTVSVTNNCGNSVLTATGTGSLLWSTGATTSSITVTTAGTYTVTRTVNGCASPAASAVAAPRAVPVLSSNLSAAVTTGNAFSYTPTSITTGTTFAWSRAAVSGVSNAAASGTGGINETMTNTTASPINVTYVYTLTANGCTNTQNLVVTVNPIYCVINGAITSSFTSTSIPAGRFIWFNAALDRGSFLGVSGTVTFNITNSVITFTANSQQYTLNVPNSRIRFDAAVTSASTQFINNVWETAMPRTFTDYVFMGGLNYQVPANLPGNITNIRWSATISIDKVGIRPTWKWAAAVYTSLGAHSVLNIKPKNGSTQNPYPNNDLAGTPENYKSFLVSGAKGSGGTNYTGSYSSTSTATCSTSAGQRPAEPVTTQQLIVKEIPSLPVELVTGEKLEATAVPNPSSHAFNLVIRGNRTSPVTVKVIDISGRVVERYEKVSANSNFKMGQRLAAGSYFIEVVQDDQKKIIRVIKVN